MGAVTFSECGSSTGPLDIDHKCGDDAKFKSVEVLWKCFPLLGKSGESHKHCCSNANL